MAFFAELGRLNGCFHKLHQQLYGVHSTRAMKTSQVSASSNEKDTNATQSEDLLPELPMINEANLSFNRVFPGQVDHTWKALRHMPKTIKSLKLTTRSYGSNSGK